MDNAKLIYEFPQYDILQLQARNKLKTNIKLDNKDYKVISNDVISKFNLSNKLNSISEDINRYIRGKYGKLDYNILIDSLNTML